MNEEYCLEHHGWLCDCSAKEEMLKTIDEEWWQHIDILLSGPPKVKMIKHIMVCENVNGPSKCQVIYEDRVPLHLDPWI